MVDLSITVPERDLVEFSRIMGLLQTKLGKTPDKAVELGAVFFARAAQASTRVAPKQRRVEPMAKGLEKSRFNAQFSDRWQAIDNRTGQSKFINIPGFWRTRQEAQAQKAAQIRFTGLAKLLWWKAAGKVAAGQAGAHPATRAGVDGKADRLMTVTMVHGEDASATLDNSSKYAALAFKSGGRSTVDTIMRRAANAMRKYAERQSGDVITQRGFA